MREIGTIVAIEERSLWVETSRQTACGSCSAQKGCGTSLLAKLFPNRQHFVRVLAQAEQISPLQVGQEITIEVSDSLIVKASLIMYLVPIALLLLGAAIGDTNGGSDGYAILGAAIGLSTGLALVRLHAWTGRNNPDLHPVIVDADNVSAKHSQILELS
ncbi:MAG: SoxR reducing system RseC family protein [Sinobacterium sp.]|jgi:sigma-E factor negative regulatory protein RseC|tara:strand:- start:763 stop:1239 length:477 start_codon:yes stop_codon:yes gene_type:complete